MLEDKLVTSNDGRHTRFSLKYNQHFPNTEDGGFSEALHKHIIPAFSHSYNKKELNILDICFGLGYNSFATIFYILENKLDIKINIYSPELDFDLIKSLHNFSYPKEFEKFKNIINQLSLNQKYDDEKIQIEIFLGDAREYLKNIQKATKVKEIEFFRPDDADNEQYTLKRNFELHDWMNGKCPKNVDIKEVQSKLREYKVEKWQVKNDSEQDNTNLR